MALKKLNNESKFSVDSPFLHGFVRNVSFPIRDPNQSYNVTFL